MLYDLRNRLSKIGLSCEISGLIMTVEVPSKTRSVVVRFDDDKCHLSSSRNRGRTVKSDLAKVSTTVCDMLMSQE